MSNIKLTVPIIVDDRIANPGEEVTLTDAGRAEFLIGMKYAEEVTTPLKTAKVASEMHDKPPTAAEAKLAAEAADKDKNMGIFGKHQPEHHDDKKGK